MDTKKPPPVKDDILITTNVTFEDHLTPFDDILKRTNDSGMKDNATKSKWSFTELEFLVFGKLKQVLV